MNDDVTALAILKQLIAIPSQNPMGHEATGDGWLEAGMSAWLQRFLSDHSLSHEYHEIEPSRGNVVAFLPGDPDRPTVLLDAHQDTVPVAGMTIDPYDPAQRDGRLYGRGACDVKGSMAVILETAVRLQALAGKHSPLLMSFTCDEERSQKGAAELVRRLNLPAEQRTGLLSNSPSIAIVSEPTDLNVVVAHKGTVRWKIQTPGVPAHSSDPSKGSNAIYAMAKVVDTLQQYASQIAATGISHPLCGGRSLSVGTIRGGTSVNIVPESCVIEIDRRLVPGEHANDAINDIANHLKQNVDVPFQFLPPDTTSNPLLDGDNQALADSLLQATAPSIAGRQAIGVRFGTHAPRIASLGIPTVVFGPGSIDQAHTKDEWIDIMQLEQATDVLTRFLTQ